MVFFRLFLSRSLPIIFLLFFLIVILSSLQSSASVTEDAIQREIRHAHTYYWFGISEKGNTEAFLQGLSHLNNAQKLLVSADLPEEETKALEREIKALRADITQQYKVNFDTMYGIFPLVRLLAPSLFADATAAGTFELIDDPPVVAVTSSGEKLLRNVLEKWSLKPQLNVVFNSVPPNRALESELLYIFNSSPNFFVHDYYEVVKALPSHLLTLFEVNQITREVKESLCEAFGVQDILIVTVRKQDVIDNNYFYITEAKVYNRFKDQPTYCFFNMGFCRDRRNLLWPIILTNCVLLLLSIPLYLGILRMERRTKPSLIPILLLPIIAFTLGRIIPWALVPLCSSIAPQPETLAKLAFWWPCMVVAVLFLAPLLFYSIASIRLAPFLPIFGSGSSPRAAFPVIALGACAYLAGPLFMFTGHVSLWLFLPLAVCTALGGYILADLFHKDKLFSSGAVTVSFIIFLVVGAPLAHLSSLYLWICVAIISLTLLLSLKSSFFQAKAASKGKIYSLPEKMPQDTAELAKLSRTPPYIKLPFYETVLEKIQPFLEGKTCCLCLTGDIGVGKTSAATALIQDIKEAFKSKGKVVRVLDAECPARIDEKDTSVTPYAPFQKAFSREFNLRQLSLIQQGYHGPACLLDGIVEWAIPMANLILPPSSDRHSPIGDKQGMLHSIVDAIEALRKQGPVVLFLDDVHWIDDASKEVLSFLLDAFPPGDVCKNTEPILILLTSRERGKLDSKLQSHVIAIDMPDIEQRIKILVNALGLDQDVAREIVAKVGEGPEEKGGLFWLLRMVGHFAESGVFAKSNESKGFTWSDEYKRTRSLPIPDDFLAALEEQLNKVTEYRSILECAACLGMEFSARVLGESLNMPRLELLQILEQIEEETGILVDVREHDDIYAFSTSFMLELIRKRMNITCKGPTDTSVPQLIREYHARVAESLEKTLENSRDMIYEVARHYYASGKANAQKALEYCISAARAAKSQFLFAQAKEYIKMAKKCAELVSVSYDLEQEELLIDCDAAHVSGKRRVETAERALKFIQDCGAPSIPLLLTVARTCYDAGQAYRAQAVELSDKVLDMSAKPLERAEAYHFKAICIQDDVEGEKLLRQAMELVSPAPEHDLHQQALLARIANSLAELLSKNKKNPREALDLYQLSLKIKERPEIRDLPGLARTHGGLGRLFLSSDLGDIDKARYHFEKDLEYSVKLGDTVGETMMHSFLGQCDLIQGRFKEALRHYHKSFGMASYMSDKFYALSGILKAAGAMGDEECFNGAGMTLVSALMQANALKSLRHDCAEDILATLDRHFNIANPKWLAKLKVLASKAATK